MVFQKVTVICTIPTFLANSIHVQQRSSSSSVLTAPTCTSSLGDCGLPAQCFCEIFPPSVKCIRPLATVRKPTSMSIRMDVWSRGIWSTLIYSKNGRQDETLQEQADIRTSSSRTLGIDSSASGSGHPITSRSSSPAMVHSSSRCMPWD